MHARTYLLTLSMLWLMMMRNYGWARSNGWKALNHALITKFTWCVNPFALNFLPGGITSVNVIARSRMCGLSSFCKVVCSTPVAMKGKIDNHPFFFQYTPVALWQNTRLPGRRADFDFGYDSYFFSLYLCARGSLDTGGGGRLRHQKEGW